MIASVRLLAFACLLCAGHHISALAAEGGARPAARDDLITLRSLLREMLDLDRLARLPRPGYLFRQVSSRDPASVAPGEEGWFANGDRGHYVRVEERDGRREFVMLDAEGPGCVVRIWSADPKGVLRVYLDGSAKPALIAPLAELLAGTVDGLPPPLAGVRARGANLYFPIPYARRCVIASDEGDSYYHIDFRTYEPGTRVKSYSKAAHRAALDEVQRVAKELSRPASAATRTGGEVGAAGVRQVSLALALHAERASAEVTGPGALRELRVELSSQTLAAALREVFVALEFDGETTVGVPLGDFFTSSTGAHEVRALPFSVEPSSEGNEPVHQVQLTCRFTMPFARSARLTLERTTKVSAAARCVAKVSPWRWDEASLHFHATARLAHGIPTRPFRDWTHLDCRGEGRLVGAQLHVRNPVRDWWGEGDEKISVDGEAFPSIFGTGSEDYFGYAWCSPEPFRHAYHQQLLCTGPGNYGDTSVARFHVLDDIPFRSALRFDMELWHWNPQATTDRAAITYWYARPGARDHTPPSDVPLQAWTPCPPYLAPRVPDAIEGEEMEILASTGRVRPQELGRPYSNEQQLWWTDGRPGDVLRLAFVAPRAGHAHIFARLTRAPDYGIHQLRLGGVRLGPALDLYRPERYSPTEELDLGIAALAEGRNLLEVTCTGRNERASACMFGLDYLKLEWLEE